MKRANLSIVAASLLLGGCGSVETSPTTTEHMAGEPTEILKSESKDMLDALNLARSVGRDCNNGKGFLESAEPLTWSDELYAAAYEHSFDMAHSDTFSHYGSGTELDIAALNSNKDRSYFYERITSNGYTEYSALGENIAGGQSSLDEVMKAWLSSPSHCANIMNSDFSEVGVAVVSEEDSAFGIYWTQNFGSK